LFLDKLAIGCFLLQFSRDTSQLLLALAQLLIKLGNLLLNGPVRCQIRLSSS
jgi:hypothetical protein